MERPIATVRIEGPRGFASYGEAVEASRFLLGSGDGSHTRRHAAEPPG